MLYLQAIHAPETPIREEWLWLTEVLTSFDGNEDRFPLNRYPKRTFSGTYEFDTVEDLRRHLALMQTRFDTIFRFPLFQHQVKLKAPVEAGFAAVTVNATRSDFRVGEAAFIFEGDTWEEMTVSAVDANSVTFDAVLVNDYSARAHVCPSAVVFSAPGATAMRRNPDHSAAVSFRYIEREPWKPFVSPLNPTTLTTLGGRPILEQQPVGAGFEQMLSTGMQIVDYIGIPDFISPWTQSQWAFPLSWQVNRVLDNAAWLWWKKFADEIQGANGEFLLPTNRADFEFVDPSIFAAPDSPSNVVLNGTDYGDHYFPLDTFKRIFIDSAGGRHYATVTAVDDTLGAGYDRLTFDPPHPDLPAWYEIERVGFLLKARFADDKLACTHYGLHTEVAAAIKTVT